MVQFRVESGRNGAYGGVECEVQNACGVTTNLEKIVSVGVNAHFMNNRVVCQAAFVDLSSGWAFFLDWLQDQAVGIVKASEQGVVVHDGLTSQIKFAVQPSVVTAILGTEAIGNGGGGANL